MRTVKLIIEYDGTGYVGWQLQPNGMSVQQVLEDALAKILGEPVRIRSSGRTDAGVHARGMVAAFRTDKGIPLRAFSEGMNCRLPPDIAVREASEADADFNPRADAKGKFYRYTILNEKSRSPLYHRYAWHLRDELDVAAMREAAGYFVGERDFAAFRASGCAARTTVRNIFSVDIEKDGSLIHIDVKGSGFLRNMVRIMAGTLVGVGQGRIASGAIPGLFNGSTRMDAGVTAPSCGLCLMEVYY